MCAPRERRRGGASYAAHLRNMKTHRSLIFSIVLLTCAWNFSTKANNVSAAELINTYPPLLPSNINTPTVKINTTNIKKLTDLDFYISYSNGTGVWQASIATSCSATALVSQNYTNPTIGTITWNFTDIDTNNINELYFRIRRISGTGARYVAAGQATSSLLLYSTSLTCATWQDDSYDVALKIRGENKIIQQSLSTTTILAINEKNETALIEMIALASVAAMLVSMFILL